MRPPRRDISLAAASRRLDGGTLASLPSGKLVGLSRFELLTPRLSSVCSNQLSYRPVISARPVSPTFSQPTTSCQRARACPGSFKTRQSAPNQPSHTRSIFRLILEVSDLRSPATGIGYPETGDWDRGLMDRSRKEVIQPQVLLQLPCYDFTPITDHTLGTCLPCGLAQLLLVQPAFVM